VAEPLAVTRHYNSEDGVFGGSFGNWRWTYDRGVFISPTEVDVTRADGKVIYFLPNGSGGWKSPMTAHQISLSTSPMGRSIDRFVAMRLWDRVYNMDTGHKRENCFQQSR
jgi:hypothetical protein